MTMMMMAGEDSYFNNGSWETTSSGDFMSQLCVPWDNLDDLEFYPSFGDDWITFSGQPLDVTAITEPVINSMEVKLGFTFEEQQGIASSMLHGTRKKLRSKRTKGKSSKKMPRNACNERNNIKSLNWTRSCTHCGVEKTPQWRTGPMGRKTLCNACGVRYKSGRLLPEYRPAASPTFDGSKHSNYHRKIMQRKIKS